MSQATSVSKDDPRAIFKHIFKVDGVLDVAEKADSRKEAERRVIRMWPRSTVEFIREEFSHYVGDYVKPDLMVDRPRSAVLSDFKKGAFVSKPSKSVEENMVDAVGTAFGGV